MNRYHFSDDNLPSIQAVKIDWPVCKFNHPDMKNGDNTIAVIVRHTPFDVKEHGLQNLSSILYFNKWNGKVMDCITGNTNTMMQAPWIIGSYNYFDKTNKIKETASLFSMNVLYLWPHDRLELKKEIIPFLDIIDYKGFEQWSFGFSSVRTDGRMKGWLQFYSDKPDTVCAMMVDPSTAGLLFRKSKQSLMIIK